MKKFYDTCSVLTGYSDLSNVIISSITLEELENIKTSKNKDDEIKFKARKAVKSIEKQNVEVLLAKDYLKQDDIEHLTNDELIIKTCARYMLKNQKESVIFYSEDLLCRLIARNHYGLTVTSLGDTERNVYLGYKKIEGNCDDINNYMLDQDWSTWKVNEYLVIHNTDDDKWEEMRYDGEKFVALRLPPSSAIKAKNSLQRCALDALNNKDISIVAILGTAGSGKTFLNMQMGLHHIRKGNYSKIIGVREALGEGKEVGYLKGDFEDKTQMFFKPFEQQLDGGEFELSSMVQKGQLETIIPFYAKGLTWNNSYIACTEAEDYSSHQIKLLGTRVGQNAKIVMEGDYKQATFNKSTSNPLIEMCNELKGNPKFACIVLDEDVRSDTSKIFADLFRG